MVSNVADSPKLSIGHVSELSQVLMTKKACHLAKEIEAQRIFMNMIIHDMRNPTSSIEFALQEGLKLLKAHFEEFFEIRDQTLAMHPQPNDSQIESRSFPYS